jgi:hypothetical protein
MLDRGGHQELSSSVSPVYLIAMVIIASRRFSRHVDQPGSIRINADMNDRLRSRRENSRDARYPVVRPTNTQENPSCRV